MYFCLAVLLVGCIAGWLYGCLVYPVLVGPVSFALLVPACGLKTALFPATSAPLRPCLLPH